MKRRPWLISSLAALTTLMATPGPSFADNGPTGGTLIVT